MVRSGNTDRPQVRFGLSPNLQNYILRCVCFLVSTRWDMFWFIASKRPFNCLPFFFFFLRWFHEDRSAAVMLQEKSAKLQYKLANICSTFSPFIYGFHHFWLDLASSQCRAGWLWSSNVGLPLIYGSTQIHLLQPTLSVAWTESPSGCS